MVTHSLTESAPTRTIIVILNEVKDLVVSAFPPLSSPTPIGDPESLPLFFVVVAAPSHGAVSSLSPSLKLGEAPDIFNRGDGVREETINE